MRIIRCTLSTFGSEMWPAPAVQAYCYLRRLNLGRPVVFMVDTGASGTCLHGMRAWELQGYMRPSTLDTARGVGGRSRYYGEVDTLVFTDTEGRPIARTLRRLDIQMILPEQVAEDEDILRVPCLLGRDILNRWALTYNVPRGDIRLITP